MQPARRQTQVRERRCLRSAAILRAVSQASVAVLSAGSKPIAGIVVLLSFRANGGQPHQSKICAVKPKRRRSGVAADGTFGHRGERLRDAPG
jgi:hypothetical protein